MPFRILQAVTICPILICLCLHYGVGGKFSGLKIGIFNENTKFYDECVNETFNSASHEPTECLLEKVSCRLLDEVINSDLEKVYFETQQAAVEMVKAGKLLGYIWIGSTFSLEINSSNGISTDNDLIQVYLDKTDLQKTSLVEQKLLEAYKAFAKKLSLDCNLTIDAGGNFLALEALIGKMDFDFRGFFIPGFILW